MNPQAEPIWVSDDEAAAISIRSVALFGGLSGEVRDENLLKAAMARPLNKWHYDDPKPDIFTLAAAYCFGLVKGHPFHDGNKRTAYLVSVIFLELNDYACAPGQQDIVETILGAAEGSRDEEALADWFRENSHTLV